MTTLPSIPVMRRAFAEKDRSFEGLFFVAVKTTGIFCRPTCRAKPPRPENLEFYPDSRSAVQAGYRPCKLCRPLAGDSLPPLVSRLIASVDAADGERVSEENLQLLGIDATTARRQFRTSIGMTFAQYQRARRMGRSMNEMQNGAAVVTAQVGAGYNSASGYRKALAALVDRESPALRDAQVFSAGWIQTPVGMMLAIAGDEGLALLEFADPQRLAEQVEGFRRRQKAAGRVVAVSPEDRPQRHIQGLRNELKEYFAGTRQAFTVPLVPAGSDFELRAWEYMRSIPYGQTRSYGEQARAIGSPGAARAVGRANGRNPIAIIVPCHRVIGSSGSLTGYGGGMARKQWLLDHERQTLRGAAGGRGDDNLF